MTDENQDVEQEVVSPQSESESIDSDQTEEMSSKPRHGSPEYNFREMRRIIQRQQQQIDELSSSVSKVPEEPEEEIPDDEIPNVKQVRKLIDREAKKKAEELFRQRDLANYEEKLKRKYKDFDSVVTKENVEELVFGNECLLKRLQKLHNENPLEANELAYGLIKKSAFFVNNQKKIAKKTTDKNQVAENLAKPVAGHALGATPTPLQQVSSFKSMTPEEKQKLWQEMQASAGRRI